MNMKNINNITNKFLITLLAIVLACGPALAAVTPAKQLAKGKQLFAANKDEEAMDAFIDVLVNGSRAEVEEANQYINLIHSRMGGIQEPVEVAEDFKEGQAARVQNAEQVAEEAALTQQYAAMQAAKQAQQQAEEAAKAEQAQLKTEAEPIVQDLQENGLPETAQADQTAMAAQQAQIAATAAAEKQAAQEQAQENLNAVEQAANVSSTFTDLTTDSALKARQLYSSQKLDSMKNAAIAKLGHTKGVRLYFRNGEPDAIDVDSEVLFNGYKFRPEAMPLLDDIYTLMALTQGASYVILPPGSYTDNVTLPGIRQAMALNSFFVHKGLSSGKISYNMGLFDQEPPAKFSNLEGLSIVFDFDAELPAALPDAASVSKLPLLSMAVVPVSNRIDVSAAEAFAIDFSVIETVEPVDNWVFQVVQHGANDTYYVVRQLEGFAPVYHQLLWNGRKGIIGPELACGTYTLSLTASDVKGGKRTIRRQVEVACTNGKTAASAKTAGKNQQGAADKNLNYKTPRLWTKPGRIMKAAPAVEPVAPVEEPEIEDPFVNNTQPAADSNTYGQTQPQQQASAAAAPAQGVNNPYEMPYESF